MEPDFVGNPGSKISVEILGVRLRWKCLEPDFNGKHLEEDSRGNPETLGARLQGGHSWSKTSGGTFMEQDFGGNPWSKTSGEMLGAKLWGKPLEQDFGGNP